jgi:hypothetical protein
MRRSISSTRFAFNLLTPCAAHIRSFRSVVAAFHADKAMRGSEMAAILGRLPETCL